MNKQSLVVNPHKILVIVMPYLGDVLLATPLLHALKRAYPNVQLDVLVFRNTAAMLEGNPDIDRILTIPNRPSLVEHWTLAKQIFRRYDLALALQTSDRSFFYTLLAAATRVNAVPDAYSKTRWKRYFVQGWIEFDNEHTHTVLQNLKLLSLLNVQPCYALVPPQTRHPQPLIERFEFLTGHANYAVLHVHPQWTYKRWSNEGWVEIAHYIKSLGLKLVFTGSAVTEEVVYINNIVNQLSFKVINLAGQVSLAELSYIFAQAKLFIGPDTGITHLAAATGIPVIALFGPTNPVKWAPWPNGYTKNRNPFQKLGNQQVNNVFLIQGEGACVPCYLEGCDRHRQSRSKCLDTLSAQRIKHTIKLALEMSFLIDTRSTP